MAHKRKPNVHAIAWDNNIEGLVPLINVGDFVLQILRNRTPKTT